MEVMQTAKGLALVQDGEEILRVDFLRLRSRVQPDRLRRELLIRASKVPGLGLFSPAHTEKTNKPPAQAVTLPETLSENFEGETCVRRPFLVDATAGLGEDAFLLAAAGFKVLMIERNETLCAMLQDALLRASNDARLATIACRLSLLNADSTQVLASLGHAVDVLYLDPMFSPRKKGALSRKNLQILQRMTAGSAADDEALLDAAFAAAPRKVLVKRHLKAAPLAGRKPHYSLKGSSIRFDVFAFAPSSVKIDR